MFHSDRSLSLRRGGPNGNKDPGVSRKNNREKRFSLKSKGFSALVISRELVEPKESVNMLFRMDGRLIFLHRALVKAVCSLRSLKHLEKSRCPR